MKRKLITLTLVWVLAFSALGAGSCSKSERDQNIAWAKDISTALHRAEPHVVALKPSIAQNFARALPIADNIVEAIQKDNIENVKDLLRKLVPIFTEATAAFTDNKQVLAILALGDIGLHVLLNHIPDAQIVITTTAKVTPKKGGEVVTESVRAAGDDDLRVLREYRDQQVWGCAYLPKKCQGNAVAVKP